MCNIFQTLRTNLQSYPKISAKRIFVLAEPLPLFRILFCSISDGDDFFCDAAVYRYHQSPPSSSADYQHNMLLFVDFRTIVTEID